MTWTLSPVRSEDVKEIWRSIIPLLSPALAYSGGRIDAHSVLDWLLDGRYRLWVAHQDDMKIIAAFVTREAQYPRKRMLTIDICGGNEMNGWLEAADQTFRAHSRELGLDGIELFGREGWTRALRRLGWRQTGVMVEVSA